MLGGAPAVTAQQAAELTIDNVWTLRQVGEPHWSPDSRFVALTADDPADRTTTLVVADTSGRVRTFRSVELLPGLSSDHRPWESANISLAPDPWFPDSERLLFARGNDIFVYDLRTGDTQQLTDLAGVPATGEAQGSYGAVRPVISPDGDQVAFVHRSEIWVVDVDQSSVRQLTSSTHRGWFNFKPQWSPSGDRLLIVSRSREGARRFPVTDFSGVVIEVGFRLRGRSPFRYGVIDASGRDSVRWLDLPGEGPYSLRPELAAYQARWSPDGEWVAVNRKSLDHRSRSIVLVSPESGALRTLVEEKVDRWISPHAVWNRWSPDSQSLLFTSERSGWNHVYTIDIETAETRQLTSGEFMVLSPQVYDRAKPTPSWSSDGSEVYFTSNQEHFAERQLYSVSLEGGEVQRLTTPKGVNASAAVSPDGAWIAYVHSDFKSPPELYVEPVGEGSPRQVTSMSEPSTLEGFDWRAVEIVSYESPLDGTDVRARLFRPIDEEEDERHPAVIFAHGAGYLQSVQHGWRGTQRQAFNRFLARKGFYVLDVDFRGSSGYGRKFRNDVVDRLGEADLQDVLGGVEFLRNLQGVDGDRIGIWGHSYGGFMVASALTRAPRTFAAGAASAPVTDWERFHYLAPGYNEEHFTPDDSYWESMREDSPLTYADSLQRPMLLISGVQDVMHLDAAALVNKLLRQGNAHFVDWLFYPNEPHGFQEPAAERDRFRRIYQFFREQLMDE